VRRCGLPVAHGYTRVELQVGGDGGEEWLVGGVADVVCALDGKGTGGKSAEVGGLAGTCWTRDFRTEVEPAPRFILPH
jgi:hypothetical protein